MALLDVGLLSKKTRQGRASAASRTSMHRTHDRVSRTDDRTSAANGIAGTMLFAAIPLPVTNIEKWNRNRRAARPPTLESAY